MVVQSPFQSDSPDLRALAHTVRSDDGSGIRHSRANYISTASETVLRTIPGLTPECHSDCDTARLAGGSSGRFCGLVVVSQRAGFLTFRKVFPEITTGGDVFQCEILVHRAIGGPMLRRNLILDAASSPVRRVQWTDLTESPMQYSEELLLPRL